MCFRPSDVKVDGKELDLNPAPCPECGELVAPMGLVRLPNCPYCGAVMPDASNADDFKLERTVSAPAAPSAPKAPGAPPSA